MVTNNQVKNKNKDSNTKVNKKTLKEEKKTYKAVQKEQKGKSLSNREQERIRLLRTKVVYKQNKEFNLRLKNVKKNFGHKKVLKGVTFDIKKGERLSLIGKNGSGKSTLINVISQQLKLSEGEIRYGYASNRLESLELMGIQFQTLNYPEGFIVRDVIHFFNSSVEKSIRMSKREISDMISMFGIDKYLDQKIDRLSGGQQQRVNILLALIKKPSLLILDEISTGLDVESAETIKGYIEQYLTKYPETSLLLVSHSDEEIRELTERVIILEDGKIVENFASKELTNKRFLEITSRDPKLTSKQKEDAEKESEVLLKKLKKSYRVKKKGPFRRLFSAFTSSISRVFASIDNKKMAEGNIVEINDVSKTYGKTVGAVRNFSLDIKDGERISITGPNGSGKSTIVEIIAQVKGYDSLKNKSKVQNNLAKADFEREFRRLEEVMNVELRNFKNAYRLERQLAELKIQDLEKSLEEEIKEIRKVFNEYPKKEKTRKNKIIMNDKISSRREEVTNEINDVQENSDKNIANKKAKFIKLEKELNKKLEIDQIMAEIDYFKKLERIQEEKELKKGHIFSKEYILNGEVQESKVIKNDKPQISYSFTKTTRGVRNDAGVQFQYASFPVEMNVLDVILFFARTNEKFLSKEEIIEAVKVFKLEKLLKSKAYRLSGGERQRLNVLLAIMKSPKLLILDEISTGLDVDSIVKIDAFIKSYLDRTGATLILISHNYHEVHSLTDRVVVMKYGELSEIVDTKGWTLKQTKNKMRDIYRGGAI